MSEKSVIERTTVPLTVTSLSEHLRACGLAEGQTVLVHMAMSKLGWVIGGAEAVIRALLVAVGDRGTIMMVTNSSNNTDPYEWGHPPVPEAWWPTIREHTPAYNPLTTPTRELGVVPELFRTWPGAVRSDHPAFSLDCAGSAGQVSDDRPFPHRGIRGQLAIRQTLRARWACSTARGRSLEQHLAAPGRVSGQLSR